MGATFYAVPTLAIITSWLSLGQVLDGSPSPKEPSASPGRRTAFPLTSRPESFSPAS